MDGNGRRLLLILMVLATVGLVRLVRRTREEHHAPRVRDEEERLTLGDVVPSGSDHRESLLDTAIEDSFPASDPPAYWGRATAG